MYEQIRRCPSCSAEVYNPNQRFCLNCGAQLPETNSQPQYPNQPNQPYFETMPTGNVQSFNLLTAYASFFKRYADFRGRSRRQEFWLAYLANLIITVIINIFSTVFASMGAMAASDWNFGMAKAMLGISAFFGVILTIYGLAIIIPSLSMQTRRLHDIGKSGKLILLNFIPIGIMILFVLISLLIAAGTASSVSNSYYSYNYIGGLNTAVGGIAGMAVTSLIGLVLAIIALMVIAIVFLVFNCTDSQPGANKYGPNPKGY